MSQSIDARTRETLRNYLREVKTLPNEAAKRQRFSALLGELFPGTTAVTEYARGVEKLIRIKNASGTKRGYADAYYGQAIIEFEKNLTATLGEAERQLCEYVAGTWQKEGKAGAKLLAIASDGISWRVYRPVLKEGTEPSPENVSLELLRPLKLADDTLSDFWLWLTSQLFRPQQIEPTAERFREDFGSSAPLFREGLADLKRAWSQVRDDGESKLAFETWQSYLSVTYGSLTESANPQKDDETGKQVSELEALFLRHTYLSSIARLMVWASLSRGRYSGSLGGVAVDVLSGVYFQSKRLANLAEDDFFHWIRSVTAASILTPTWERVLSNLLEYDLSSVNEDVLKGVYQQLIDPKDRHDLGEYYTPDWLCERIVVELLPKNGFKTVLDPGCGSGSFLRAAITHFLRHNPDGTDNERLRHVLASVNGIDIHPVAVTIARATYVLALGPLVKAARKPIQIPVFLADSLFLPDEIEPTLIEKLSGTKITFGSKQDQRDVVIPTMLINSPELFDEAIAVSTTVAQEHSRTNMETRATLAKSLARSIPSMQTLIEYEQVLDALWSFTVGLSELIRKRKNSIWSFIIRNGYRPAMLRQHFDFIIGNPPWLSYRYISDPVYQKEIKTRAVERYEIAPRSQKLFTQMELATVFLAHAMATFARPDAKLAFVMPRSVLSADQHQNLIQKRYSSAARFKLTGYWDLWDVRPLFNVPSCVLFARWTLLLGSPNEILPVEEWHGILPDRDVSWAKAAKTLSSDSKKGRVVYLGARAAFSTLPGTAAASRASRYAKSFKQGATLVPRNLFFVNASDLDVPIDSMKSYWAETDEKQAKESKKPYAEIRMKGMVEGRFIFTTALSRNLLPFAVLEPLLVVLPLEQDHGYLTVLTAKELKHHGYRDFGAWMEKAESVWLEKRKGKSSHSLQDWLDYSGKLTAQLFRHRHLVLYNAAGTNVSAAYFDRHSHPLRLIVEHKVYWAAFSSITEANYLTAVLNSEAANLAIKPFQSTGLLGERDIEKKLLDLPIPLYDPSRALHSKIAALGLRARKDAAVAIANLKFPSDSSLARQRAYVRKAIEPVLSQINELAIKLL